MQRASPFSPLYETADNQTDSNEAGYETGDKLDPGKKDDRSGHYTPTQT